jgi:GNAT superfamily N-acetyltransferase
MSSVNSMNAMSAGKTHVTHDTHHIQIVLSYSRRDAQNGCVELIAAATPEQVAMARRLFEEYAAWLAVDLCFQGFTEELAGLPGVYAPPRGRLFLATDSEELAGCVALRPVDDDVCEMKRLYVRPAFQRRGIGKALVQRTIAEARIIGYSRMVLDTLASMEPALCLYESFGFAHCAAYYKTPLDETVFLEMKL